MTEYAPFCVKQVNYLKRCYQSWLNIAEGGKRAGKNVLNIMAWCEILEHHPDKLHLAAGVSVASTKLNIIDSNGYGVSNWFKGRCRAGKYQERDALYVQTATGEKVILISGGGKEGDERYIKGNTYGSAYITEVNECCKTFVKEVFDRTLSSKNRKLFFDLNPKAPAHWFYEDILDFHTRNSYKYKDYGLNYEHFTLHDNFSFSNEKIREIIRTYKKNTVWYLRDILGKRTNAEGIIYDMFNHKQHVGDYKNQSYIKYGVAVDYGTNNPCTFGLFGIDDKKAYMVSQYWYDSNKKGRQKTDSEYADDFELWLGDIKPFAIYVDPSAASFIAELRKRGFKVVRAKNDVVPGIRFVANMLSKGRFFIDKSCVSAIKEFASYIWNPKAKDRGEDEPLKQDDHAMDMIRYFLFSYYKRFQAMSAQV